MSFEDNVELSLTVGVALGAALDAILDPSLELPFNLLDMSSALVRTTVLDEYACPPVAVGVNVVFEDAVALLEPLVSVEVADIDVLPLL